MHYNTYTHAGLCLICLFTFTCISCDPGQYLKIENRSPSEATIKFVFNEGSRFYRFEELAKSDTVLFRLNPSKGNSVREFYFGIGTWGIQGQLDSLISFVELIEIDSWKSKEIFEGDAQIRAFFESRVKGRHKEGIEIIIE